MIERFIYRLKQSHPKDVWENAQWTLPETDMVVGEYIWARFKNKKAAEELLQKYRDLGFKVSGIRKIKVTESLYPENSETYKPYKTRQVQRWVPVITDPLPENYWQYSVEVPVIIGTIADLHQAIKHFPTDL